MSQSVSEISNHWKTMYLKQPYDDPVPDWANLRVNDKNWIPLGYKPRSMTTLLCHQSVHNDEWQCWVSMNRLSCVCIDWLGMIIMLFDIHQLLLVFPILSLKIWSLPAFFFFLFFFFFDFLSFRFFQTCQVA